MSVPSFRESGRVFEREHPNDHCEKTEKIPFPKPSAAHLVHDTISLFTALRKITVSSPTVSHSGFPVLVSAILMIGSILLLDIDGTVGSSPACTSHRSQKF